MFCNVCGKNTGDSKFCANCGNALPVQPAPPAQEQIAPPVPQPVPPVQQAAPPAYTYMPTAPAPVYQPEPQFQPQPVYAPVPAPVYVYAPAPARKLPVYNRWWFWLLMLPVAVFIVLIVIGIAATSGKGGKSTLSAKDDLRAYFTQYQECAAAQAKIGERIGELSSMDKAQRLIALVEISSAFEDLVAQAEAVEPQYQKLKDIHAFFLSTVKAMQAAYDEMVTALFQNESDAISKAGEAIKEAANNQLLVMVKLAAYAKELGIEGFGADSGSSGIRPV